MCCVWFGAFSGGGGVSRLCFGFIGCFVFMVGVFFVVVCAAPACHCSVCVVHCIPVSVCVCVCGGVCVWTGAWLAVCVLALGWQCVWVCVVCVV